MKIKQLNKKLRFKKLYNAWGQVLYRFIYYKIGDQEASEDLVQDLFVKVWEKIEDIKEEQEKSYLFAIARNMMINKSQHDKVVLKYQDQIKTFNNLETPQYEMEVNEYKEAVQRAIESLSDGQKEVFLLSRIEGYKYREIAELLGISQKAVEKRMNLALIHLKNKLNKKL